MADKREEKEIIINGMRFVSDLLLPNYNGDYDCICSECIFDKDWIDFGENVTPCLLVKCIRSHRNERNYNVWSYDNTDPNNKLKSKEERKFNECKQYIPQMYKIYNQTPEEIANELECSLYFVENYCSELDCMSEDELNAILDFEE